MIFSPYMGIQEAPFRKSFFDELEKISEAAPSKKEKFKKWLKSTAVLSAGYGIGHGSAYAIDRVLSKNLNTIPLTVKHKMLGPAVGIGGAAASYSIKKMIEHHRKSQEK